MHFNLIPYNYLSMSRFFIKTHHPLNAKAIGELLKTRTSYNKMFSSEDEVVREKGIELLKDNSLKTNSQTPRWAQRLKRV